MPSFSQLHKKLFIPRPQVNFARGFWGLAGGYWSEERSKWRVRSLSLALIGLTVLQVVVPVLINLWSQKLFDALEQKSMERFLLMIAAAGVIIAIHVSVTICHLFVKRMLQLGWRKWLFRKVQHDWLSHGRQYQITYLKGDHSNPDGRLSEDIRISTEYAIDLGLSLLYCILLLFSFINILWMLSGIIELDVRGISVPIPGHLLFIALLYAAAGTTVAMLVGQPLVRAVNQRQGCEADFRFGLARIRENAQAIALLHGESDERRGLFELFRGVRDGWNAQTRALAYTMTFSAAYSVLSTAVPVLVAAPRYITGAITLGVLMQTAQAFQQTVAALSWPIDNLPRAAEWKASVERVLGLVDGLRRLDEEVNGDGRQRIVVSREEDGAPELKFYNVAIHEPDGTLAIKPFSLTVHTGDRVLIVGDPSAAIRLFRAVARVWIWGSGEIVLPAHTPPAHSRVFFMPQRPYLPHGSLRAALAYPGDTVNDVEAVAALVRVGLAHLCERLDNVEAWDEVLAAAEQQRLGFARMLIRKPDWIFFEDATDSLDADGEDAMLKLLDHDRDQEHRPPVTVLTIGSHARLERFHGRKLILERTNGAVTVREGTCQDLPEDSLSDPVV